MLFNKIKEFWPFILIAILVLLFVIIFISMLLAPDPTELITKQPPTGSKQGVPLVPPEGSSYQVLTPEVEIQINHDEAVGQLIKVLPYQSQLFSLEYDFSDNTFVYWYKNGQQVEADQALLQFLRSNGIEDRSWLINLVIQSE